MKNKNFYTVTDLAEKLSVTRQTIYYWIKKRWITPKRDYRNYPVFTVQDLKSIEKWHSVLSVETRPMKQKKKPAVIPKNAPPLTWEGVQKLLFK